MKRFFAFCLMLTLLIALALPANAAGGQVVYSEDAEKFFFLPGSDYLITGLTIWACMIIELVLNIKRDIRVAKSFGKGKGWGVLLFFFPFIISLILGYGKAEYIGNTTIKKENK